MYSGDELSDGKAHVRRASRGGRGVVGEHPEAGSGGEHDRQPEPVVRPDAGGSACVPKQTVATGAHLLRTALDFDRLITRNRSFEETLTQMRLREQDYDPACLKALAAYVAPERGMAMRVLKSSELLPGMVVDQDVRSKTGLLLLAKGQEVTLSVLGRLRAFAAKVGIAEPVRVLVEAEPTSPA